MTDRSPFTPPFIAAGLLLGLLLILAAPGHAAPEWPAPLPLEAGERIPLGPHAAFQLDQKGHGTPQALLADPGTHLSPLKAHAFNLGVEPGVLWVAFRLDHGSAAGAHILNLDNPLFEDVRLFSRDTGGRWHESERNPAADPAGGVRPAWRHTFRLPASDGISRHLLRIDSGQALRFYAEIQTPAGHRAQSNRFWMVQGFYHGMILALALYNLFLFVTLRDTSYAWYIAFVLSTAAYFLFQRGLHLEFFPQVPIQVTHELMFAALALMSVFALQFTRRFLITGRRDPALDRLMRLLLPAPLLGVALSLWTGPAAGVLFFSLAGLGAIVLILVAATRALWLHRFTPAAYLLGAWSLLIPGMVVFIIAALGWLPNNAFTYYGVQVGSALEAVLLSLALADRIRSLRAEREALARRGDQLERITLMDELTGLYNRRHLERHLPEMVAEARRRGDPLSILIIDADDFKRINDTHGHPVGDQVLIRLGQALADSVRRGDTLFRYGGEEFVALLAGADAHTAREVARRMLRAVSRSAWPMQPQEPPQTVSIGLATLEPDDTPHTLFLRADKALYEAKQSGKNRVRGGSREPGVRSDPQ
ncbi:MAG: diguanylate cyclase domain-containing protein [Ectothiorhodospira sp.]